MKVTVLLVGSEVVGIVVAWLNGIIFIYMALRLRYVRDSSFPSQIGDVLVSLRNRCLCQHLSF